VFGVLAQKRDPSSKEYTMSNKRVISNPDHKTSHTSTLRSVIGAAAAVVDRVEVGQLTGPTPCDEWDVRALLNHMVATARMFAIAAEKGHIPDGDAQAVAGDLLATDFHGAWKDASEQLVRAFEQPEALDKVLSLPFGDVPGDAAVDLAVLEVGIHSADLARATRQHIADQAPFAAVLSILRARMTDAWRAPGILNDEQPVPPNASTVDELLAFAGRHIDDRNLRS
jgi:uncharacterized protein (TIGR03086 family)